MQTLSLTTEQVIEVLSLYATADTTIYGVVSAPGWIVIGSFPMPASADIRLDAMGSVSGPSLVMSVRLYDTTPGFIGPVSGSTATIVSTTMAEVYSSTFSVVGGHTYQVQAQVVGNVGNNYFGSAHRVAPIGT